MSDERKYKPIPPRTIPTTTTGVGPPERTLFERDVERVIVDATNALLNELDRKALRYDVDKQAVEAACHRFSGPDLADCWAEFVGEAEL